MGEVFLTDFGPIDETVGGGGGASTAADVTYGGGPGLTSPDVEAALDELATEIAVLQADAVTRTLWTSGGANDLGDWTETAGARITYGTGTDVNGTAAATGTVVQGAGPPTTWVKTGSAVPGWASPLIACTVGDVFRVSCTMSWDRTANSLTNPAFLDPSLLADYLVDESNQKIRYVVQWNDQAANLFYYDGEAEAGVEHFTSGWLCEGIVHVLTSEFVIVDPAFTSVVVGVYAGPVWTNAAGVVALTSALVEKVSV